MEAPARQPKLSNKGNSHTNHDVIVLMNTFPNIPPTHLVAQHLLQHQLAPVVVVYTPGTS
jgi:hypothetical protein